MKIKVFIHVCCMNTWKEILHNQLEKIIFSGLYDEVESVNLFCILQDTSEEEVKSFISNYPQKVILRDTQKEGDESFTMTNIHDHVDDDTKFLYLHTKGVTRSTSNVYYDGKGTYFIPNIYSNVTDWRNVMEYYLIKEYKNCIKLLEDNDTVGINFTYNHYSGNFFWCTGRYYNTIDKNIFHHEGTLTRNRVGKFHVILNTGLEGYGHYFNPYPYSSYIK